MSIPSISSNKLNTSRNPAACRIGYKPRLLRQLYDTLAEELPLNWDEALAPRNFQWIKTLFGQKVNSVEIGNFF
jgi:hypothetical protein